MRSDQGFCEFRRTTPKPTVELGGIEPTEPVSAGVRLLYCIVAELVFRDDGAAAVMDRTDHFYRIR